jgi:hypothetical protein
MGWSYHLGEVNSLCEEPSSLCSRGRDSTPPASTNSLSPIRLLRRQHLDAVLPRVRRTRRRSNVRLASRDYGNRFVRFPTKFLARGVPGGLLIPLGVICHTRVAWSMWQKLPNGVFLYCCRFCIEQRRPPFQFARWRRSGFDYCLRPASGIT